MKFIKTSNSENHPLLRIGRTSSLLLSSRFILRRRTASEVSEPQLCRLLVVRIGIEPILCRRYPTFVNRRPNDAITSSDYIGHGFGFPICVHTFSSCVFIRFKNPVPTEKSLLFVPQKLLKRPYRCVVFFTRLSFYIYILNPTLIRREPNRMT